jgi:hypothetical protein
LLPDGRVLVAENRYDHTRLMVWEAGKQPVPLVNTPDETFPPVAVMGSSEVAFMISTPSPKPHVEMAIANISTGTIRRRVAFDKVGLTNSLAPTPDGKMLFLSAGGSIWSIPSSGGEAKRFRAGNGVAGVDPSGQYLLVEVYEHPKIRLMRVPLDGSAEREIPLTGPYRLAPNVAVQSGNISKDGHLLAPLTSPDSSFVSPGMVDLATGQMTRIPVDPYFDYGFIARSPGGQITAVAIGLKSTLWKFQPEDR